MQMTAKEATTPRMQRVTASTAMARAESKHKPAVAARKESWEAIGAAAAHSEQDDRLFGSAIDHGRQIYRTNGV